MAKVVRKAAKSAAEGLKPGYCLTSLSEATRTLPDKPPTDGQSRPESCQNLKAGYCLTSLSEATRKLVDKPPKALRRV